MSKRFSKKRYDPNRVPRARKVTVNEKNTLLPFLFATLSDQSKSSVKTMLGHGQISVNGHVSSQFDMPVEPNDVVTISYERGKAAFNHPQLKILWEDNFLMVVQKKEGLLSVGNAKEREKTALQLLSNYVRKEDNRNKVFVLHRLDKDTSGLMLFARNKGMQEAFQRGWNRLVSEYSFVAVVEGVPEIKTGLLTNLEWEDTPGKKIIIAEGEGEDSIARYTVEKQNGKYSLLHIQLEGGRRNQIRAQLAEIGHPVIGDKRVVSDEFTTERLMLHARTLYFTHPETGMDMSFETQIPYVFTSLTK